MDTIFTVRTEDLERLDPKEAVEFFRELLWAEARRRGIAISRIHVSTWINVPDGGVDASVEEVGARTGSDLIKPGCTAYQIKTGKNFEPWQDAEIRKELFGNKNPDRANLGSSVQDCLDKNGTYVLVCFKLDLVNPHHKKAVETIVGYLKMCGYDNPAVEVWSQSHLIGFLKGFPALALNLNGRGIARFQTHRTWSTEAEMRKQFQAGQKQSELTQIISNELRRNDEAIHIRVWGDAGMGKTRLALEATRETDLAPLVIYCDSATKFRDSDLMNEILKEDNPFCAILVLDECDPDARSYIWNKLKYFGPRIKLVSVYNEFDETSGQINYVDIAPLEKEQTSKIIQGYDIPKDQADRWADLCSGSPRMAHVIGQNLKNNPEDLLKSPDTVNVWDRYVVGGDDPESMEVQQRRAVLRYIALFKRFGFNPPVTQEAQSIALLVQKAYPAVTWPRFQEIIYTLRSRKILQGEITLYITPKGFHIKLWIEWWDTYGNGFELAEFSKQLSPQLLEWFYEMFKYAAESELAQGTVRSLLGEKGPFQRDEYLKTKLGARFFLALAEADPKSALECLKKTVGTWNRNDILGFTTGRREVVWALERIAMWADLFADAARILLTLAEGENETYANSASGVFADLFSPGPGAVAPTEAPPEQRFPVLKEALDSPAKEKRLLGLQACDHALESQHFARMAGAEHQGLRKEAQLWTPKTYGELFDAYRRVWKELCGRLNSLSADEQRKAIDILLKHARGLLRYENLASMITDTLRELIERPFTDRKKILAKLIEILHYEGKELPVATRQHLEQFKERLTGSDFSSLLRRYAGMDLLEDQFDEAGNQIDQRKPRIEALAQQAVENDNLLWPELGWLVTTEAENGFTFGYELGTRDNQFGLLPGLIEAQRKAGKEASAFFVGGYFRAIYQNDRQKWEKILDSLVEDEKIRVLVPELTWRSGPLTDRAALRVLGLAQKGYIQIGHLRLFAYGSVINPLSDEVFKKWLQFLLNTEDRSAVSASLNLCDYYYLDKETKRILPEELSLKLLVHGSLFRKREDTQSSQMDDYHWTRIGKAFVNLYPDRSLELAEKIVEHFGEDGTIVEGFHSSTQAVLNEIATLRPKEIWTLITKYLGPPIDSRAFRICLWLRGGEFFAEGEGALTLFAREDIWNWVDQDVEKRAWYVAHFAPTTTSLDKWKGSLAREVLVRYGHRKDVRNELRANYSTEGWWGPESAHHQGKKQILLQFKNEETNKNVKQWLDEYVSILDEDIKRARIEEERRGF